MKADWYVLDNVEVIDSPALVIHKDRVLQNIDTLVHSIDDISRLRPHIKTHKSSEVAAMMLNRGILKFKCATIAEAEMLASVGAPDVLLAYQPVGPKGKRFLELAKQFPKTTFSCLVDNEVTLAELATVATPEKPASVFIDLNVGMNRTGIVPSLAFSLWEEIIKHRGIIFRGLHAYDGHIRDEVFALRQERSDEAFQQVFALAKRIESVTKDSTVIVAGGTPTFSVHSKRSNVECSPGTFIYWDKGYEGILKEQKYLHAAVLVTRIVSKPAPGILCTDLGHKSVASENPLPQRITFLNGDDLEPIGHSEEHLVLRTSNDRKYRVGDVLYGIPYHVCPTIALYERCGVAEKGTVSEFWTMLARNKKITI